MAPVSRHASDKGVKLKALELIKLSGTCVHVGTNVSIRPEERHGM